MHVSVFPLCVLQFCRFLSDLIEPFYRNFKYMGYWRRIKTNIYVMRSDVMHGLKSQALYVMYLLNI